MPSLEVSLISEKSVDDMPLPVWDHPNENGVSLFSGLANLFEEMLGADWLKQQAAVRSTHPAVNQWGICCQAMKSAGVLPISLLVEASPQMGNTLLTAFMLAKAGGVDPSLFKLGAFLNYGDPRILNRLREEAKTSSGYFGVMSELMLAGWCAFTGIHSKAIPEDHNPDFLILDLNNIPTHLVECKSIEVGRSVNRRIRKRIREANGQIKNSKHAVPGIAIIRLEDLWLMPFAELASRPPVVDAAVKYVASCLAQHNRSVSAAAILWDQCGNIVSTKDKTVTQVVFQRQSVWIHHQGPRFPMPVPNLFQQIGNGVTFEICRASTPM